MARNFVRTDPEQYLEGIQALTDEPLTMACWFKTGTTGAFDVVMEITGDAGSLTKGWLLEIGGDGDRYVYAEKFGSGTNTGVYAKSSAPYTAGSWQHATAVFASSTSRKAYVNGGNAGTDTTDKTTGTTATRTMFGSSYRYDNPFDGDIAEAAVWNVELTADEIASLSKGVSPLLIRPGALVAYWPMIGRYSPEIDRKSGIALTIYNGASTSDHPPVIYPRRQVRSPASSALAPISGSLSATLETIAISATDNVLILGALDGALDGVSVSIESTILVDGSLSVALSPILTTSSGELGINGSLDISLGGISITSAAALKIDGSVSATLDIASLSSSGSVHISGGLSSVLSDLTISAYERPPITGLLSVTLADLQSYISAVAVSDMKTLQDFLPFVLPLLPSAPEPVVIIALRNAAIRFCERSRAWRHVVEIETDGNEYETITIPDQSSLFEIEEAWFKTTDGNWRGPLKRIQFSKINADDLPSVGDTPTGSPPECISQQSHDKLVVYPIAAGTLRVSAFVTPSQSAVLVPDFLYDRYAQVIADGALAHLLMIPEQPYTNAQLGVIKESSFDEFCDHKFNHNIRGQQRASGRVRSSFF